RKLWRARLISQNQDQGSAFLDGEQRTFTLMDRNITTKILQVSCTLTDAVELQLKAICVLDRRQKLEEAKQERSSKHAAIRLWKQSKKCRRTTSSTPDAIMSAAATVTAAAAAVTAAAAAIVAAAAFDDTAEEKGEDEVTYVEEGADEEE
ncbi:unnamed protein product, partial [Scytosiphon promiscuus]